MMREDIEKRKRGRPKKEKDVRTHYVGIRLTDDEFEMLKFVCESASKNKTEIILQGIKAQGDYYKIKSEKDEFIDEGYDDYDEFEDY